MSKKQQKINMLVQIHKSINDIESDAENQTAESIKKNMSILGESILEVLKIDGVGAIRLDSKVGED